MSRFCRTVTDRPGGPLGYPTPRVPIRPCRARWHALRPAPVGWVRPAAPRACGPATARRCRGPARCQWPYGARGYWHRAAQSPHIARGLCLGWAVARGKPLPGVRAYPKANKACIPLPLLAVNVGPAHGGGGVPRPPAYPQGRGAQLWVRAVALRYVARYRPATARRAHVGRGLAVVGVGYACHGTPLGLGCYRLAKRACGWGAARAVGLHSPLVQGRAQRQPQGAGRCPRVTVVLC